MTNEELLRLAARYAESIGAGTIPELTYSDEWQSRPVNLAALKENLSENLELKKSFFDHISLHADLGFAWQDLQEDAQSLAFLYNFVPFQDTGSTVAAKRLRELGATVDVISCSMLYHKKVDLTVQKIVRPYLGRTEYVSMHPSWASWDPFQGFAVRANKIADRWVQEGRNYERVYSRAMWAPSIYAAALFKKRHQDIHWLAEFSDPLSLDVEGKRRGSVIEKSRLFQELISGVPMLESYYQDHEPTVFGFAENLVYALADEVIFTNENQRSVMLNDVDAQEIRDRAEKIGRVSNHPTLPSSYYKSSAQPDYVQPEFLNIAYFGEFYASRGISEVMHAVDGLPIEFRDRVRLHVFTNYAPGLKSAGTTRFSPARQKELEEMALRGVGVGKDDPRVLFHQSLAFLDFLSAMSQFDVLVLSDADSGTGHEVNPYLPSKWSDYSGSGTPVWALVEEGSVLSTKSANYITPRGSVEAARKLLETLLNDKFTGNQND